MSAINDAEELEEQGTAIYPYLNGMAHIVARIDDAEKALKLTRKNIEACAQSVSARLQDLESTVVCDAVCEKEEEEENETTT